MKIIQVHNRYRSPGGEGIVLDETVQLLKRRNIDVSLMSRNSQTCAESSFGKFRASFSSLYSFSAARAFSRLIEKEKPDVIHVHNIYPLLSPSILVASKHAGIPVVMTCHNYRLVCPIGLHLRKDTVCEMCDSGREYWCVLKNCRGNIFESFIYALRTAVARKLRLFYNNISVFIAPTEFLKQRLVKAGFSEKSIAVLPNMVSVPTSYGNCSKGNYVLYVGRISQEKGIDILLSAIKHIPTMQVKFVGDGPLKEKLLKQIPSNATFLGYLNGVDLEKLYQKARFLILPSKGFEVCPLVISEAMSYGLPVIASRIGGLSELVEDGVTGFLFEPNSSKDLLSKIELLWKNSDICGQMGKVARGKAIQNYSEDVYFTKLISIYEKVINTCK